MWARHVSTIELTANRCYFPFRMVAGAVRAPPSLQVSARIEAALKIAPLANQAWQQHSGAPCHQNWSDHHCQDFADWSWTGSDLSQEATLGRNSSWGNERTAAQAEELFTEIPSRAAGGAEDPQEEKTRQKEEMQQGFKEAKSVPRSKERSAKEKLRLLRAPSRMSCNRQAVSWGNQQKGRNPYSTNRFLANQLHVEFPRGACCTSLRHQPHQR